MRRVDHVYTPAIECLQFAVFDVPIARAEVPSHIRKGRKTRPHKRNVDIRGCVCNPATAVMELISRSSKHATF